MAYVFRDGEVCFLHTPKTGGRFVTECLALSEPSGYRKVHDGHGHQLPSRWDYPLIFTVIRHPTTWLRSFWGHRNRGRWSLDVSDTPYTTLSNMTQKYASNDFAEFAWNVTENLPGLIGWFFGIYTPPPVKVVKLEELYPFLEELGAHPTDVEPQGMGEDLPEITQETKDLIAMAEVRAYIRYGYKTS